MKEVVAWAKGVEKRNCERCDWEMLASAGILSR
jgi:hypothetical protein